MDWAFVALDHATESVVDAGGPLVPFAMTTGGDGGRRLQRFTGDLEQGLSSAREAVAGAAGAVLGAVAWDGYLTAEDRRMDAVFVEASERGEPESVVLAQRYVPAGTTGSATATYGNPRLVARRPSLFASG